MLLIHSKVATKEVFATLLVLSRLLNSGEDKGIRNKYKEYINCGYSIQVLLEEIQNKYGVEPHITCLMCDI
jgi:hypothetical protein